MAARTRRRRKSARSRRRGGRKPAEKPAAKSVKIVRYHMNGCKACNVSEKAWDDFCNNPPPNVEHEAIESNDIPETARIEAFPTYIVLVNGKEVKRQVGAITSKEGITQLLPG
jgi:hypothetical protein